MPVTINGTSGITSPDISASATASVNGIYIGRGPGGYSSNTVIGANTVIGNTIGANNTVAGYGAAQSNTTGSSSVAVGRSALGANTIGGFNVAVGAYAASGNLSGTYNTTVGYQSGTALTSGSKNSILGSFTGNQGGLDIRTASNYIVLSDGDGNPRVIADTNGNVGVGAASPNSTTKFYVSQSSGNVPGYFNTTAASQNVRMRLNTTDNASSISYVLSYSHASLKDRKSVV